MSAEYDEWNPAPGERVHYWPQDQDKGGEPLAALVVNTGRGEFGPHLVVFNAEADGFRFERSVSYGGEFPPAPAGTWTWPEPGGRPETPDTPGTVVRVDGTGRVIGRIRE